MPATTNDPGSARATLRGNAAILNDHKGASHGRRGEDQRGTPSVGRCKSRLWRVGRYELIVKKRAECLGRNVGSCVVLLVCEMSANCQTMRGWSELVLTTAAT